MSEQDSPDLSIVIPAYNEAQRLPSSLARLRDFFDRHPASVEILAVVEKSTDGTLEAARFESEDESSIQVIDNEVHKGKGYAVRCGMLRARGELLFFMDADLSTSLEEINAFVRHFEAHPHCDVLIGSRATPASRVEKPQSVLRRSMGLTFNLLARSLGVVTISDTQCGFKAFRRVAAREIFTRQKLNGFSFDVEVLLLAQALGYRVDVLPVQWLNSPDSRVQLINDSLAMMRDLLRVRWLVKKTLSKQPVISTFPD